MKFSTLDLRPGFFILSYVQIETVMTSSPHQSSSFESILLFEAAQSPINDITYFDELGNKLKTTDKVLSIRSVEEVKYLILESGEKIKLELVYSVDNEISPFYSEGFFNCDCV